ncbi:hypothetical protein Bbelb_439800 [Branchiostoma belcheri]|nr:hypothetical protein Bbelb_439800 [Branchiostoma belcheri]
MAALCRGHWLNRSPQLLHPPIGMRAHAGDYTSTAPRSVCRHELPKHRGTLIHLLLLKGTARKCCGACWTLNVVGCGSLYPVVTLLCACMVRVETGDSDTQQTLTENHLRNTCEIERVERLVQALHTCRGQGNLINTVRTKPPSSHTEPSLRAGRIPI